MKLSVIIPALNEADYIGELLDDLAQQNFTDFEVIVSDSHSDDDTATVAKQYHSQLDLTVVSLKKRGVSLARNGGADVARGEDLLFLDADLRIGPECLSRLMRERELHPEAILSARIVSDSKRVSDRFLTWCWSTYFALITKLGKPRLNGGCILVSRSTHRNLRGFDESIASGEDSDYGVRAKRKGIRSRYIPRLTLEHSPRRFNREGRLKYAIKGVITEINKLIGRKDKVPEYKFGHYRKKDK